MDTLLNSVAAYSWILYLAVFVIVFIESAGAPIPGLSFALGAAALAGTGQVDFWWVYLASISGGTLGGVLAYGLGYSGGRPFLERFGPWIMLTPARLNAGEFYFKQHGTKAILFGRYLPFLCFLAGVLGGLARLPFRRFCVFNFLSILLWSTTHLSLAYFFGRSLDALVNNMMVAAVVLCVVGSAVVYFKRRRKPKAILAPQPVRVSTDQ